MASSAGDHPLHLGRGDIPTPPPPTPSNHSLDPTQLPTAADAALSQFLCQLTLSLSLPRLPSRFSPSVEPSDQRLVEAVKPSPPAVSLVRPPEAALKSAVSELGFFHLTDHGIPLDLPTKPHLECQSLFLTHPRDLSPLGLDVPEAGGGSGDGGDGSYFLVFDVAAASGEALPPAICDYARRLERVGMDVVEMMSVAGGFHNPFRTEACRPRFLLWISDVQGGDGGGADGVGGGVAGGPPPPPWGRCYPYVVCLQYEMRSWSKWMLVDDDEGWVALQPHGESLLVAVGDIAQVWSDGRFRKVRGRPVPAHRGGSGSGGSGSFTISLLVTLPTDSTVAPLPAACGDGAAAAADEDDDEGRCGFPKFSAFPFEQYAWRLFHGYCPVADPLRRYRL